MPVDERKYYNRKLMAGTFKSELKNNSKMSVGDIVKNFPAEAVGEFLGEVFDDFGGGVVAEIAGEIIGGIGENMQNNKNKISSQNQYSSTMSSSSMNEKMSEEDAEKQKKRLEDKYGGKKKKKNKKKKENENKNNVPEQVTEEILPKPVIKVQQKEDFSVENMTAEKLQNAVIWSEVLGEPVCRRRRSRRR